MTPQKAAEKLNKFIELHGAIAHRGAFAEPVAKVQVTDYFDLVKRLADGTDNQVISHVTKVSGKNFRRKRRKKGTAGLVHLLVCLAAMFSIFHHRA